MPKPIAINTVKYSSDASNMPTKWTKNYKKIVFKHTANPNKHPVPKEESLDEVPQQLPPPKNNKRPNNSPFHIADTFWVMPRAKQQTLPRLLQSPIGYQSPTSVSP